MIVPKGSRWARGLSVSLPCKRGVGSPRRSAAKAWLNSWIVIATISAPMPKRNSRGLKEDPNIWYSIALMAYQCELCSKKTQAGRQHTHHTGVAGGQWKKRAQTTFRSFAPNLHMV